MTGSAADVGAGLAGLPLAALPMATRHLPGWAAWHGRLMVLSWTVVLPTGAMVARFGKRRHRDAAAGHGPAWWQVHRWGQTAGVLLMSAALLLVLAHARGDTAVARAHHLIGWSVVAAGWIQASAGALRGSRGGPDTGNAHGDHYDMTPRRVAFEWLHKTLGWLVIPLVWLATALGLVLADAPRWMALLIAAWWLGLLGVFVALQRRGRCLDTYQSLWGADPRHPGNRRRPIGWGIRRPDEAGSVAPPARSR